MPDPAPHSTDRVPFLDVGATYRELASDLDAATLRVLGSGWYLLGDELQSFEREYATYVGASHAAGCGNGLEAIELLLRAWGVGPGDEVIVPSNTYIATWIAVSNVGAEIVPCEPDLQTFNINPNEVERLVSPRTRAIIAVHLYGQPVDLRRLRQTCSRHGIVLLEDAAQAHGASIEGVRVGGGSGVAWSFYPGKNLGAFGDGGAVTTDDRSIHEQICKLRNYGSRVKYENDVIGINSRLDELQAASLRVKLEYLDEWNERRRAIASVYASALAGNEFIVSPCVPAWAEPVWHLYVVRTPYRGELARHLLSAGIETLVHYPIPPHLQKAYDQLGFTKGRYPISEQIHDEVLSLPIGPHLPPSAVSRVAEAVESFRPQAR